VGGTGDVDMTRNISFALTTEQVRARAKTVTRRFGWWFLKPGDVLCAVEKGMGLKKGEKVVRLGLIRVVSVRRESASAICRYATPNVEVSKEGFPGMLASAFVGMLCKANGKAADDDVNRIEFEYLHTP